MSWAAHELESVILHRHMDRPGTVLRISYMAILIGALMPDFTKLPVYGLHIGQWELIKAPEPWMYHRGWPGSGPTHSLVAGILVASALYVVTRSKPWGIGVLVGYWSHVLTDTADSVGTMMFFPFTTQHYSIGMWQYSSQQGRYGDAAAYYSSLGWAWDVLWLVLLLLLARKVLTAEYFHTNVEPADPFWGTLQHKFRMPDHVRRAVFRAYVVYGAARLVGWFLWARLLNPKRGTETMDLSWTGPGWVPAPPRFQVASTWGGFAVVTIVGVMGTTLTAYVAWRVMSRLPERPGGVTPAAQPADCDGQNQTTTSLVGVERVMDDVEPSRGAVNFSSVGRVVPIHRVSPGPVAVRRSSTSRQAGSAHDRSDDHDTRFAFNRFGSRGAVPHDTVATPTALVAGKRTG